MGLPVSGGRNVVTPINKILDKVTFDMVVRSQDWHCNNHVSFASQHEGEKAGNIIPLNYTESGDICGNYTYVKTKKNCSASDVARGHRLKQMLWPDHCVINTTDAGFVDTVKFPSDVVTVQKGYRCQVDSYSAFNDNGNFSHTELHATLRQKNIKRVYVAGLAADYCVSWTAKDAIALGYESYVVLDATQHIGNDTLENAKKEWKKVGVKIIDSDTLIKSSSSFIVIPSLVVLVAAGFVPFSLR